MVFFLLVMQTNWGGEMNKKTLIFMLILMSVFGMALLFTSDTAAQFQTPSLTEPEEHQLDTTMGETLVVPFSLGTNGVQTNLSYIGAVTVTVAGVGQASGTQWSDAFYIYTDSSGLPIDPRHPTEFYNWTLWINGGPADNWVQPIPPYNDAHIYNFSMNAPGSPLTFAVGDAGTGDNTGAYTITLTQDITGTQLVYLPLVEKNYVAALRVPVLVLAYYPPDPDNSAYLDPVETGWTNILIANMQNATQGMINAGQALINDATRYHGYKDPKAPNYLEYYTYDKIEYFVPMPRGFPLGGTQHRPHYNQILSDIDICDHVDNHGVKEVWIYGYHAAIIVPDESKMSSKYGDVSNAFPKDESIPEEFRLPQCANSYVMYNFTYQPGGAQAIGNNIHNRMHQIENVIFFAEDLGYPANDNNVIGSLFWDDFSVYGNRATLPGYRASCGNTHSPPNTTDAYVYDSTDIRENNCETWHPDDSLTTYVSADCTQWGCTDLGFYQWFMQNIPGDNNGIIYEGKQMRNWWNAMYDFNEFIDEGRSLFVEP